MWDSSSCVSVCVKKTRNGNEIVLVIFFLFSLRDLHFCNGALCVGHVFVVFFQLLPRSPFIESVREQHTNQQPTTTKKILKLYRCIDNPMWMKIVSVDTLTSNLDVLVRKVRKKKFKLKTHSKRK